MGAEKRDWYETPLFYDIIFDADTGKEADFLEAVFHRFAAVKGRKGDPGRVLEPACGSGRLVHEMARRGWRSFGFDASEAMLEFAGRRCAGDGGGVRLWKDRMESFRVPGGGRFDLAHCLVSTFKYLLTEEDAQACLGRISGALKPGGIFVLGVHLTDYSMRTWDHERWEERRDGVHVVSNTRCWAADRKTRLEPVRNRLRVTSRGETRVQETEWHFRTYDAAQLRRTLRQGAPGLEVMEVFDFTYDLDEPRAFDDEYSDVLLVLRKRTV